MTRAALNAPNIVPQDPASEDGARIYAYLTKPASEGGRELPREVADYLMSIGFAWIQDLRAVAQLLNRPLSDSQVRAGVVIPYFGFDGRPVQDEKTGKPYVRLRPEQPSEDDKGKAIKYSQPKSTQNHLYIPPGALDEAQRVGRLVVTEGEFKAAIATYFGFPAVAVAGVWSWRTKSIHKRERVARPDGGSDLKTPTEPIAELGVIDWRSFTTFLCFDSDAATNPDVQRAERALIRELESRGASVRVVRLPDAEVRHA